MVFVIDSPTICCDNGNIVIFFEAGTKLVWYIDPLTRTANIYTAPDQVTSIDESGMLDGSEVMPGFQLRLGELFERASRGR